MPGGFSTYLDALRFFAALVVVLSHFAYARFSDGRWLWVRDLNLGSDAVVVFFVLSGFVIAHVAATKPGGGGQYAFDRVTRLVSVALPALLFGFALDRYGAEIAPHVYAGWVHNPLPLWEMLLRGLTFSNEWGGMSARLGTNGPYWSLSYEAAYYALFGVAIYTHGVRRLVLLALGGWIVGLNILLLMPAWLMGVAAQGWIASGRRLGARSATRLAVLPVLAYAAALALDLPELLRVPLEAHDTVLRFSDEFLWNTGLAALVALHLVGMAGLSRQGWQMGWAACIRWLAGGSFSLYLVHYPVLQVLAALRLASDDLAGDALLLGCTLVICYGFAELSERRLPAARQALGRVRSVAGRMDGAEAGSGTPALRRTGECKSPKPDFNATVSDGRAT